VYTKRVLNRISTSLDAFRPPSATFAVNTVFPDVHGLNLLDGAYLAVDRALPLAAVHERGGPIDQSAGYTLRELESARKLGR
jgi:hypothetical protein